MKLFTTSYVTYFFMRASTKVPAKINLTRYLGGRTTRVLKKKKSLIFKRISYPYEYQRNGLKG